MHTIVLKSIVVRRTTADTDWRCKFIVVEDPSKQLGEQSSRARRPHNPIEHRDIEQDKIDPPSWVDAAYEIFPILLEHFGEYRHEYAEIEGEV